MKNHNKSQAYKSFSIFKLVFVCTLIFGVSCKEKEEKPLNEEALVAKAKAIHERVITLDTHCDIDRSNFTDSINYSKAIGSQVDVPIMIKGGLDVVWLVVYTGQDEHTEEGYAQAYETAISKFNAINRLLKEYAPNQMELATTSDDVRRIHASGKKIVMIGIENGYPIGTDINRVKEFYDLGARYMSLSHNGHSQLCDSNTGEEDGVWLHNGVSELGKQVIAEMNKYGMMIDISHPSKEAIRDMVELSKAPIIASHSSARALCDHSRNLDDEQLEWIKKNGGVVQTVAFRYYLDKEKSDARSAKIKDLRSTVADSLGVKLLPWSVYDAMGSVDKYNYRKIENKVYDIADKKADKIANFPPDVDVVDFVDHIDYMVDKIGVDHVGISSDFNGGGGVAGWDDASETLNITIELVKRGYTEEDIEKLWSSNLLRVLDEVQKVAQEIQASEE